MGVDVAGGADVAVAQPDLDVLQRHAVGVEQAGAGVAQIVEANTAQTVIFQEGREGLGQIAGLHQLSQIVDVDVVQVVLAVAVPADQTVLRLALLQRLQIFLEGRHQGQAAAGGFRLGAVLGDDDALAVHRGLGDGVADRDGLLGEVNGVPLEPHDLAPAQAVEGGEQHAQLQLRSLHQLEELFQLLGVVGVRLAGVLLRALDLVRRIAGDQIRLVGVLQGLSDIGMVVQHGAGLDPQLLDLVAVEGLDVAGRHLLEQQLGIVLVEVGVDPGADGLLVGGVGGDLQAGLHHVQPVRHEGGEEDRLLLHAPAVLPSQLLTAEGLLRVPPELVQHGLGPLLVALHGQVGRTAGRMPLAVLVGVAQDHVIDPVAFSQMS